MSTEHLGVYNWIRRYEALNVKAIEERAQLLKIERQQSVELAKTLTVLRDIHRHLKAKPICKETEEYPTVQQWVEDWAKPFLHLETRQIFHMISVGEHLLGKVTNEKLEDLGIEKAKCLAEVVRSKGKVSEALVEKAQGMTARDLKVEVRKLLHGGNPDHAEGQWTELIIRGPQEHIGDIQEFLRITRRQEGNGPSDAELIALVLKPATIEIEEAEERRRKEIACGEAKRVA